MKVCNQKFPTVQYFDMPPKFSINKQWRYAGVWVHRLCTSKYNDKILFELSVEHEYPGCTLAALDCTHARIWKAKRRTAFRYRSYIRVQRQIVPHDFLTWRGNLPSVKIFTQTSLIDIGQHREQLGSITFWTRSEVIRCRNILNSVKSVHVLKSCFLKIHFNFPHCLLWCSAT
jgi:hypothetical protein